MSLQLPVRPDASSASTRRPPRTAGRARPGPPDPPASQRPVASVTVDVPLAHLDRPFDYLVSEAQSAAAVPGARVRVRFAGREVGGYVVERRDATEFAGQLALLRRVVSAEPVLAPEIASLARIVADRWAGTMADVLRLAIPPRHATVENEPVTKGKVARDRGTKNRATKELATKELATKELATKELVTQDPLDEAAHAQVGDGPRADPAVAAAAGARWDRYRGGAGFLRALATGGAPRAVWTALPGEHWPLAVAAAVRAAADSGRGVLVVVPDARDVDRADAALAAVLGTGSHVVLRADLGPAERYRRWLAVRRGHVRVVLGTRAACYAPVADLGLVVVWDDGDDLHAEPHAPYAHARDVLTLRAHEAGAAALLGGTARTAEAAALVRSGWARSLGADRATTRRAGPRVQVTADDTELARDPAAASARLPSLAWRTAREALTRGPVLVQVPRGGYLPVVACRRCRTPARCRTCPGPLALGSTDATPTCAWCGTPAARWECGVCGDRGLRAVSVGSRRTAEELGRAFPGALVRSSGGDAVLADVPPEPALVVCTPGAEPDVAGGYAAALLLDGNAALSRPDLRAGEETLRRWLSAATLVRPAAEGGVVVVVADPVLAAVQALVRWDPAGHADRELDERTASGLPPAVRLVTLQGPRTSVLELLDLLALPPGTQVLGPVPATQPAGAEPVERAVLRVRRADGAALAAALRAGQGVRSARKAAGHVRIQIDPLDVA